MVKFAKENIDHNFLFSSRRRECMYKKKIGECKIAQAPILMQDFCNIPRDFHKEKIEFSTNTVIIRPALILNFPKLSNI